MLYDMWSYEKPSVYNEDDVCATTTKYYYPNYGFNDLRDDPFISKTSDHYKYFEFNRGSQTPLLQKFVNEGKYTFHSPDTHFAQPTLGNILKLESEEYGESKGYFNVAENQAQYKLLTANHYNIATLIAKFIAANTTVSDDNNSSIGTSIGSNLGSIAGNIALPGVGGSVGGLVGGMVGSFLGADTDVTEALQKNGMVLYQTEKIIQLFKNLADYQKLQYQYQAIGKYKAYKPITAGNKQRKINNSAYLTPNKQSVNNVFINNTFRESSVYLDLDRYLASPTVQDTSRTKILDESSSSLTTCKKYTLLVGSSVTGLLPLTYRNCDGNTFTGNYPTGQYIIYCEVPPTLDHNVEVSLTEMSCVECQSLSLETKGCNCKGKEITSTISSYYGSIKVDKISQYGGILNQQYIDASQVLNITSKPVIFGGDTFITPFALKRKHSFFNTTTYGLPDDTDIFYQDLGNVGYPTYYFNTKENNKDFKPNLSLLLSLQSITGLGSPEFSLWESIVDGGWLYFAGGLPGLIGSIIGTDDNNERFKLFKSVVDNFAMAAFDPTLWIKAPSFSEGWTFIDVSDLKIEHFKSDAGFPDNGTYGLVSPLRILGPNTYNVTVNGCEFRHNRGSGLVCGGSHTFWITDNAFIGETAAISDPADAGLYAGINMDYAQTVEFWPAHPIMSDVHICRNVFRNNTGLCISVGIPGTTVVSDITPAGFQQIEIIGNDIFDSWIGINFQLCYDITVAENKIRRVMAYQAAGNYGACVEGQFSTNINVQGNTIDGSESIVYDGLTRYTTYNILMNRCQRVTIENNVKASDVIMPELKTIKINRNQFGQPDSMEVK